MTDDRLNRTTSQPSNDQVEDIPLPSDGVTPRGMDVSDAQTPLESTPTDQEGSKIQQRVSGRNKGKQVSYRGMCNMAVIDNNEPAFNCLPETFSTQSIPSTDNPPKSLKMALSTYDGPEWMAACKKEMTSLQQKNVWSLTSRPRDKKVIRGMWLFKRKIKPDGSIKHKARYVAMGNTQVAGEDYGETFAPTGKPSLLRLLIAVAATQGWEVHQMDAFTAFLNSDLIDEVYVEQPEGFKDSNHPFDVWRLNKSLYGLKQSPKLWQDDVKLFLVSIGFSQCEIDPCIYVRNNTTSSTFTAVYVHVDDLAITGNDINTFKNEISSKWEMDDPGITHTVVGIEIRRINTHQYSISQEKFAEAILARFKMSNCKPASTPLSPGMKLYRSTEEELKEAEDDHLPYRNAVGSLMYLAQCTRPDLAHAVGVLSQHLENPSRQHWDAVTHVLRYVRRTSNLGIIYSGKSRATRVLTYQYPIVMPIGLGIETPGVRRRVMCS